MDNQTLFKFVSAKDMADLLGVKARNVRRWARDGRIPKLVLPSGRFVFNPEAVVRALQVRNEAAEGDCDEL
jgi:predicted site-specific integrase-resolvase